MSVMQALIRRHTGMGVQMEPFIQESLRIIKRASEDNKLVVVVGAGVSMLSHFPSWKEVIDQFAGPFSEQKEKYSQNEYLRIPQKYYNLRGHKEYYDLLRDIFDLDLQSNLIHDEILKLNPVHLITTNYDDLLEQAIYARGLFYDVIAKDEEVSQTRTKKFLIKMHGDVRHQNVVLKENDYLSYSRQFRLIETMVKSIIASNTTLFVGYSLNDRNMKLILNWVKELQGSSFQPVYLLYLEQMLDHNSFDYYKSQGIHVIDVNYLLKEAQKYPYLERYRSFFQALSSLNLENMYQHVLKEEKLAYQLRPLIELKRARLKDLRLLIEDEVSELGELTLLETSQLKAETFELLKKAGICRVSSRDGEVYELSNNKKNYLMPPYTSILSECCVNEGGSWQHYDRAYYQFRHGNWSYAYDLYKKTAVEAFKSRQYLLYFLAQFNRYFVGKLIVSRLAPEEGLGVADEISQLNLELLYYHLPASFKRKYVFLADLSNFSFINQYLSEVLVLADDLTKGSSQLEQVQFKIQELFEFIDENKLVINHCQEVTYLYKKYIEMRLMQGAQELDSFTLYLMIHYMSRKELQSLIARMGITRLQTKHVDELIEYGQQVFSLLTNRALSKEIEQGICRMRQTLLEVYGLLSMDDEQLIRMVRFLFGQVMVSTTIGECLEFLTSRPQLCPVIEGMIEQQLIRHFVGRHVLHEFLDVEYVKLASFLTGPNGELSSLVRMYLNQLTDDELIMLFNITLSDVREQIVLELERRWQSCFNFRSIQQAIEAQIEMDYQPFANGIYHHLQRAPKDLITVAQWILCQYLREDGFEELMEQDKKAHFLIHYHEGALLMIEDEWLFELPVAIHRQLAQSPYRKDITGRLIQNIRDGKAPSHWIKLFFDVYEHLHH